MNKYINDKYFKGGSKEDYYDSKFKEGGIYRKTGHKLPHQVILPTDSYLMRFHDGDIRNEYGEWWSSPHELYLVLNYYSRWLDCNNITLRKNLLVKTSSIANMGIMHAVSAIRRDWADKCPSKQLASFTLIKTKQPMKIFYDEGVIATNKKKNNFILPPEPIEVDGKRWVVRQVCIPRFWDYQKDVADKIDCGETDSNLFLTLVKQHGLNKAKWEKSLSPHYRPSIMNNQLEVDLFFEQCCKKYGRLC